MNNEREIAEKMIADADRMAKEGQAKLDALDKPKLSHGWYGTNKYGDVRFIVKTESGELANGGCQRLGNCAETLEDIQKEGIEFGNFIDDLKAMAEPLEECLVDGFSVHISFSNNDHVCVGGKNFLLDKATDLAHKILRVVATAKLKQAKKEE